MNGERPILLELLNEGGIAVSIDDTKSSFVYSSDPVVPTTGGLSGGLWKYRIFDLNFARA